MLFFFFFQAEDGIRDVAVTGVQTCALPISASRHRAAGSRRRGSTCCASASPRASTSRTEERRVGKECRSRWPPCHSKQTETLKTIARAVAERGSVPRSVEGLLELP